MAMSSSEITFLSFIEQLAQRFEAHSLFFGHGTDNAFDEAVWLVFYGLGISPLDIEKHWHLAISKQQQENLAPLIDARIDLRQPTAYILKRAWFAGLEFIVDERVLIPRSPIAELIVQKYQPWLRAKENYKILDLCCGSGCIGLASVAYLKNAHVDLADISCAALQLAEENTTHLQLDAASQLIESDLFANIKAAQQYDLIVSNPPYVDAHDLSTMPEEYHHEPRLGLEAGNKGLQLVRKILFEAPAYLKSDGVLIVEVGNSAVHVLDEYPQVPFTWLEFSQGGDGVFLLDACTLAEHKEQFSAAILP